MNREPLGTTTRRLRIALAYPIVPPEVHGIGDHTFLLAEELRKRGHEVRIFTSSPTVAASRHARDHGLELVDAWPRRRFRRTGALFAAVDEFRPDFLVLQFEQFTFGPRGFNPVVASLFARLAFRSPTVGRVLFAHEAYVTRGSFKRTLMWAYQRIQFIALVRSATLTIVTTRAWIRDRVVERANPVVLPAFSNIPRVANDLSRAGTRARMGLSDADVLLVMFGGFNVARSAPHIREVLDYVRATTTVHFVYLGRDSSRFQDTFPSHDRITVIDSPPADAVSSILTASDIAVSPFAHGVTARNGSFMAAIQHELPTVTTIGQNTDPVLRDAIKSGALVASPSTDTAAFAAAVKSLVEDSELRTATGAAAARLYSGQFSREHAADVLEESFRRVEVQSSTVRNRRAAVGWAHDR